MPYSFICPLCVAALAQPEHFEGQKRCFAWQVQGIGHLFIRVAGVELSAGCETLAGVGQNERCFWRWFLLAGAVGENRLIRNRRGI